MRDRYLFSIIKNNWKALLILILIILVGGYLIKNIGEIPYENQHMMTTTTPVEFQIEDINMRGSIYLSYWVEGDPKKTESMTSNELGDYLMKNAHIDLNLYKDELVETLKTYNPEEIKENWVNNYDFFKKRDVYYIDNDEKLMEKMKTIDVDINLKHQYKKIFFVYLDKEEYNEFIKSLD
ncbi:MAG: hypothetical protein U5K53_11135 [Halanaerobiales bacterium]|nr:hypothetical protein [Halanaerobiales bacterium]